jgi:hypothetical protein
MKIQSQAWTWFDLHEEGQTYDLIRGMQVPNTKRLYRYTEDDMIAVVHCDSRGDTCKSLDKVN